MQSNQIEEVIERIVAAAREPNFNKVIELAGFGKEVEALEGRRMEMEERLKEFNLLSISTSHSQYRKCLIEVTPGSIQYSYLLVSGPIRKRLLAKGEVLKIKIPATGETFSTGIYWKNKNLSEREAIGRFYKAAGVKAGDLVALTEIAPNEWTLTKSQLLEAEKQNADLGVTAT